MTDLNVSVAASLGLSITADLIQANASAECGSGRRAAATGDSIIKNLRINSHLISTRVRFAPNSKITVPGLPGVTVIANEQHRNVRGGMGEIIVHAVRVKIAPSALLSSPLGLDLNASLDLPIDVGSEVVISAASSEVSCR